MKPLRERNQALVGVVTVILLILAATGAFFAKNLPVIGSGTTYSAAFSESAGLVPGNEVQIAGVKVGEVRDVSLDGNRVLAEFTVDSGRLGASTRASIEIKTLLGEKFLQLEPAGSGQLDPDRPIPVNRTTAPFDIPDAITELTDTTGKVDADQLAHSFRAISDSFSGAPQHMDQALDGLSRLSESVASRDARLTELLHHSADVSKIVADRNGQVGKLMTDADLLMGELTARREAIHGLLVGTQRVSDQLRGLVGDNARQLRPALDQLNQVTGMLNRNQDSIGRTLQQLAPYVRAFNNTVGTGRWYDGYLCGLLPPPVNAGPVQINPKGCEVPPVDPARRGP